MTEITGYIAGDCVEHTDIVRHERKAWAWMQAKDIKGDVTVCLQVDILPDGYVRVQLFHNHEIDPMFETIMPNPRINPRKD